MRETVRVRAIRLTVSPEGEAVVSAEMFDSAEFKWVDLIKEQHVDGGVTSHIIEAVGMRAAQRGQKKS